MFMERTGFRTSDVMPQEIYYGDRVRVTQSMFNAEINGVVVKIDNEPYVKSELSDWCQSLAACCGRISPPFVFKR